MSKVAPELVNLYDEYSSYLASRKGGTFRSADPLVRVIDDRVVIDAVVAGDVNVLEADLESQGMQQPLPVAGSSQASCRLSPFSAWRPYPA